MVGRKYAAAVLGLAVSMLAGVHGAVPQQSVETLLSSADDANDAMVKLLSGLSQEANQNSTKPEAKGAADAECSATALKREDTKSSKASNASAITTVRPIPLNLDSFEIRHQTACECNSRQGCGLYAGGGKHAPDTFDSESYDQMDPEVLTRVDWTPKQGLHASAKNLGGTVFANHNNAKCKGWLRQNKRFEDRKTACVQHLKHCSMYATIAGVSAFQADNTIFHISDSVCPAEENNQLAVTVWFKKDGVKPTPSTRTAVGCMKGFDDMERGRVPGTEGSASNWKECTADDTWTRYANKAGASVFLCPSKQSTKTGTTVRQHECEVKFDPLLDAEQVRLELRCVRKECTSEHANSGTCCTGVTCVPRAQKMIGLVANGKDIRPAYGVPMEDAPESVRFRSRIHMEDMKVDSSGFLSKSPDSCPRSFMQLKTPDLWNSKKTVPLLKGSADKEGDKVCENWEFYPRTGANARYWATRLLPAFMTKATGRYHEEHSRCSGSDANCLVQNGGGNNDMKVSETFSLQPVCMAPAEGAWAPSVAWCGVSCANKKNARIDKVTGQGIFGCNCLSTEEMNKQPPVQPCTSKPKKAARIRGHVAKLNSFGLEEGPKRTRVEYAVSSNEYAVSSNPLRDNSLNAQRCAGFKPEATFEVHWRFGTKETNFNWNNLPKDDKDVVKHLKCTIQREIRKPILSDAFEKMQNSNQATRDLAAAQVGFHICPGVMNNSVVSRHFEQWEVDETLGEFRSDPVVGARAQEVSISGLPLVQRKWYVTALKRVLLKKDEGRLAKWMICMHVGNSSMASEICCVTKFLADVPPEADHKSNMTAKSRLKMF